MNLGVLQASISLNTSGFSRAVNEAINGFGRIGNAAISLNQSFELVKNMGRVLEGTIVNLTRPFIDAARTAEGYRTRLDILLGSQQEGARMFKEMADFAEKSVFEYRDLMGAATQLSGIMKGGVDDIRAWMPLVADLAAVTGLSIQETTGQVVRMYSAGAASADLFRERGVLALMGFTAGVSYSVGETRKKMTAAWEATDSKFRGASDKLAKTWDGLIGMFSDKWFLFRSEVMSTGGLFDGIKAGVQSVISKLDEMKKSGELSKWAATMASTFIDAIGLMGSSVLGLAKMFTGLKGTLDSFLAAVNDIRLDSLMSAQGKALAEIDKLNTQLAANPGSKNAQNSLKWWEKYYEETTKEIGEVVKQVGAYTEGAQAATEQEKIWNTLLGGLRERVKLMKEAASATQKIAENNRATLTENVLNRQQQLSGKAGLPSQHLGSIDANAEQQAAMRRLEAQLLKRRSEAGAILLPDMAAKLKEIDASTESWIKQNEKLVNGYDILTAKAKEVAEWQKGYAQAQYLKESVRALDDQADELDFNRAIIGMTEYEAAIAKVSFEADKAFKSLERMYGRPGEEGSLEWPKEQVDRIAANLAKGKENVALSDLQKVQNQIRDAQFENSLLGLSDQDKIVAQINFEMQKLGDTTKEAVDAFEQLKNVKLQGLHLQVMGQIKEVTNWENRITEFFKNMESPMADFLEKFAETGKLSFAELGQAFAKQLRAMAAKYAAMMLMEATKEGVLGLISLASDDGKSGEHFAAAAEALSASTAFVGFIAGSGLTGMAHDGINSIPEQGTWLLDKGERVVGDKTNRDLTEFLKNGSKPSLSMTVNIGDGANKDSVLEALPVLRDKVLEWVNEDISNGGATRNNIMVYAH